MLRRDRQPSWSVRAAGMPSVLKQQKKILQKQGPDLLKDWVLQLNFKLNLKIQFLIQIQFDFQKDSMISQNRVQFQQT